MNIAAWLTIGIAVTAGFVAVVRRAPAWAWILLFAVVAVALPSVAVLWGGAVQVFTLVKTVSVGAAGLGIAALRFGWGRPATVQRALWVILAINILEAVAAELTSGPVGWMNPLVGVIQILCLARPDTLRVDEGPRREVNWPVGRDWVLVYCLWNAVFVYSSGAPDEAFGIWMWVAILHIGVPLAMTAGRAERFLELRTIALFVVVCWVDTARTEPWVMHSTTAYTEGRFALVQALSLAAGGALLLRHLVDGGAPGSLVRALGRRLTGR